MLASSNERSAPANALVAPLPSALAPTGAAAAPPTAMPGLPSFLPSLPPASHIISIPPGAFAPGLDGILGGLRDGSPLGAAAAPPATAFTAASGVSNLSLSGNSAAGGSASDGGGDTPKMASSFPPTSNGGGSGGQGAAYGAHAAHAAHGALRSSLDGPGEGWAAAGIGSYSSSPRTRPPLQQAGLSPPPPPPPLGSSVQQWLGDREISHHSAREGGGHANRMPASR